MSIDSLMGRIEQVQFEKFDLEKTEEVKKYGCSDFCVSGKSCAIKANWEPIYELPRVGWQIPIEALKEKFMQVFVDTIHFWNSQISVTNAYLGIFGLLILQNQTMSET